MRTQELKMTKYSWVKIHPVVSWKHEVSCSWWLRGQCCLNFCWDDAAQRWLSRSFMVRVFFLCTRIRSRVKVCRYERTFLVSYTFSRFSSVVCWQVVTQVNREGDTLGLSLGEVFRVWMKGRRPARRKGSFLRQWHAEDASAGSGVPSTSGSNTLYIKTLGSNHDLRWTPKDQVDGKEAGVPS